MSRDRLHLLGACLVLLAGIWANTGTLNPLAVTLDHPIVWDPCTYLLNIDHFHHKAPFLMLDGAPRESWDFSVVLRRILYPLVAYPFMKALGFEYGGILVNALLAVGALLAFWHVARRRFPGFSRAALWLVATWPGIFYWAGSPYGYAAIVPLSLLSLAVLWRLQTVAGWRGALLCGLVLGVLFTAYDLMPFFGAAGVLLLLHRRLWRASAVFAVAQLAPQVVALTLLYKIFGVPLRNANSEVYAIIVKSYLSPVDGQKWALLLAKLPSVLVDVFLFGNVPVPAAPLPLRPLARRGGSPARARPLSRPRRACWSRPSCSSWSPTWRRPTRGGRCGAPGSRGCTSRSGW